MTRGLAIIGNCSYSALLKEGSVEWLCWPRPDSSFVFGPLLDREQGGAFAIEGVDATVIEQSYIENTNVLRTVFRARAERSSSSTSRRGSTSTTASSSRRCSFGSCGRSPASRARAFAAGRRTSTASTRSAAGARPNHIEFTGFPTPVRLTTNVPLTYVEDERPFLLEHDRHLVLTWGEPLEAGLEETAERFLERTLDYWRRWVKGTRVPRDYQREVVRSALALKLHQYEDTGALLAATTTSLPEHPGPGAPGTTASAGCATRTSRSTRSSDSATPRRWSTSSSTCATSARSAVASSSPPTGSTATRRRRSACSTHLSGYNGDGPVRIGNQAFEHVQNDVYGEMVLAVSRLFLDARFVGEVPKHTAVEMIQGLVDQMDARLEEPDAGLWEFRGKTRLHSFSVLMHWAGSRRAAEVAEALDAPELAAHARSVEERARELLETRCWNDEVGALTQVAGEPQLDAAMLLAIHLGYFEPDDPRASRHVDAIRASLSVDGGLLRRYTVQDDFGHMEAAFTVCTFWLVEALALIGRTDEARELFDRLLEPRQRARPLLRGHPPGHARADRQLPADVQPRRPDQRRVPSRLSDGAGISCGS